MCTHNQCFGAKKRKKYHIFHLKNIIFANFKNICIMHGYVCVMITELKLLNSHQQFFLHIFLITIVNIFTYTVYMHVIYWPPYFWMLIRKKLICSSTSGLWPKNGSIHVCVVLKMSVGICII